MTTRTGKALTLASVLLVALSTMALATDHSAVTVHTSLGEGSRQLAVYELVGTEVLEDLSLRPGTPSPFRVEVVDTDYLPTQQFDVMSRINNLYLDADGTNDFIESEKVAVAHPAAPVAADGSIDASVNFLLSGTGIDCTLIQGLVTLSLSQITYCLSNVLSGGSLTFSDVPVAGPVLEGIDLSELAAGALPIDVTDVLPQAGSYADADYSAGTIGEAHPAPPGDPATELRMLAGRPLAGVAGDLQDALEAAVAAALDNVSDVSDLSGASIVGDLTDANAVIQALQGSGNANVAALGTLLGQLSLADATTVVNGLLTATFDSLGLGDLANLAGRYAAFPRLTVDPEPGTPPGDYSGTLTVTLVE